MLFHTVSSKKSVGTTDFLIDTVKSIKCNT